IAESNATLIEKRAEAQRRATAAEKIQTARALQEAYAAEQEAEQARYMREKAALEADILVKTEIEKRQKELMAEAEAEQIRRKARGEADAIYAKMEAEARGMQEMLTKQAIGLGEIVKSAGGEANDAMRLMIADKLEELTRIQVDAIKNLKIDKVTVWDGMNGGNGTPTTANFLSGMLKSVPPMNEMFNMAGMELPELLGKKAEAAETEQQ
ncbi:MAG: flotillin family protein, partial [Oscillospiraceae bacterium]|nr:flotillin family protein [Oscillospiraceae bacterium]